MAETFNMYMIKGYKNEKDAEIIEEILKHIDGIIKFNIEKTFGTVELTYDDEKVSREEISNKLKTKGFELKY
ncbi:heavy-metal-associated domain-containing protein [Marinitoga arctica]